MKNILCSLVVAAVFYSCSSGNGNKLNSTTWKLAQEHNIIANTTDEHYVFDKPERTICFGHNNTITLNGRVYGIGNVEFICNYNYYNNSEGSLYHSIFMVNSTKNNYLVEIQGSANDSILSTTECYYDLEGNPIVAMNGFYMRINN